MTNVLFAPAERADPVVMVSVPVLDTYDADDTDGVVPVTTGIAEMKLPKASATSTPRTSVAITITILEPDGNAAASVNDTSRKLFVELGVTLVNEPSTPVISKPESIVSATLLVSKIGVTLAKFTTAGIPPAPAPKSSINVFSMKDAIV